ncbi:branched-chain amino acid aminotransferase [Kordiimonas sp. SCSIO 12603]|uniref:branched-chain amino acid aminotransferase n=1 Tax=Kordiimonas sp. SCSIO 12603 TaxID=2829596 RepID=UPI0021052476|nr:branched-chain amino acid aminotransferase [Kordiimonas sp. SCSIO 12603]UTW57908.1 branched-chain amino acid aminotransferase [Kordiimonas sp. SCSIO 12603]
MTSSSFADRDGTIWMNGEYKDWKACDVHVLTHAMHYGSSVFEGQRAYNGKIFKLEEHTERLFASADTLDMTVPFSQQEINDACNELLEKNNLVDAYCRPVIWRGSEMMGVSAQHNRINAAIAVWEWPSYFSPEARLKGLRLNISDWRRPAPDTAPVHAKAAGLYMICTLSKHAAEAKGYDDSLMFDYRGQVAEATGANIFFVKDGEIHTPTPDCFLDGITRRTVMDLAKRRGIKVTERAIMPEEMEGFEQAFLTGTAAEVSPLAEIGQYNFEVGEITKQLMFDYDALVRGEL